MTTHPPHPPQPARPPASQPTPGRQPLAAGRAAWLAAPLLLGGCMSLAPPPLQPALPVPPTLTDQAAEPPAAARARFDNAADHPADSATGAAAAATPSPIHNPRLRQLLDLALAENRDLRLAMLAVERARAQYGIAQAERLPTLNANANANRSRSADDLTTPGRSNFSAQYSASVGLASYEIDFWGRVRQLNEAALQEFFRSQSTRDSARISLSAELMLAWLNLDADARRLQLAQATLQARQQQHALLTRSHALGAASALTLAQSQTSLDSARTDLASLQAQLARGRNALALLAGSPVPGAWLPPSAESAFAALAGVDGNAAAPAATAPAGTASSPASSPAGAPIPQPTPASAPALALPAIEPGMPSTLLLARPDVRAAEHGLKAASAQIGVARAAFFPSISLTASLGSASNQLSGLFAGGNGTWSFAPQIRLPIFDAGRNQANLRVAELARETALAHYEKTIQAAFRDTLDALAERASLAERLAAQTSLTQASARALELSQARFRLGADNDLSVLDAERSLYAAQQGLIAVQLAEQANRVQLYKALGGPWPGQE